MKKKNLHTNTPTETDITKDQRNEYTKKLVPFPEFKEKPDIDTPVEVSDVHLMLNGQTLYTTYVAARHARFQDGGSFVAWNHLNPQEQEAWNETAAKFV